ncbi:DNRLRE domain-containing protein [Dyadobacter flavalbus]|uniref:DNRLRE domain-containing protein n=1 Tax=Dyadobacter flavalbus TaxID=2579942 RepID=A0A5M8Q9V5_9BACT|nr:ELWxxDGT repeat protein [Dyadobacter flavalbus]KAA6432735.1 DNRLRE domain-containing protein [Dyadobacter flavalbus]
MKRIVLYLAMLLSGMQPLLAQEKGLVKDINVTGPASNGLRIYESIGVGNMVYMIADNGLQKKGIWKSDGTAAGTVLIKEITEASPYGNSVRRLTYSGEKIYFVVELESGLIYLYKLDAGQTGTASLLQLFEIPYGTEVFVNVNGILYFGGRDGLMKTDGTVAGTVLVKSFYHDFGLAVKHAVSLNGMLYFLIEDYLGKLILYKSDGTAAGTVAITNTSGSNPSAPLVAAGGNVYFKQVLPSGTALFKANNTTPVTLVKKFTSGADNLANVGNELYFSANDGVNGNELWKTDGSTAGTVLVKNINPGAASSDPSMLRAADGQLFFVANDGTHGRELWRSGGTASSTKLVRDIRAGELNSDIKELTAVGSKAAFVANDGSGEKLWQSNGDVYSTKILADVTASRLLNVNGTLYFNGNAGSGLELFKSTMVTGGTSAVTNIAKAGSMPLHFTAVNGVSYFTADDGIHGRELWKTDGSTAGTVLVRDAISGANSSNPEQITNVNGTAFFVGGNGSQVHSLWKSGGTTATTIKVKDFTKADTLQGLINVNGTLFFGIINGTSSMQLWKSDGSTAGTLLVKTFPQTSTFSPVTMNGQVYFGAYDGINSIDLWKSNGTAQGTVLVKDVTPNWGESMYRSIAVKGNFIYYITSKANRSSVDRFLVKSDGTAEGTTIIKQFNPYEDYFSKFTVVNDLLFFVVWDGAAFDDIFGEVVWRTDGTEQGTFPLTKLRSDDGDPSIHTHDMLALNGFFYFVPDLQGEIWKSDGTVEGTQQVTNIGSQANGANIRHVTVIGETLYFSATNEQSGREVWKTNGTAQTTSLAYDMNPNGSTLFYDMGALNNQLLISADNGMYGAELFQYKDAVPMANTIRINAGGQDFTTATKKLFIADKYYAGIDRTSSVASGDILNTTNDVLYQSARCSPSFSYNIPVPNGTFDVYLHFAETYFGAPGKKGGKGSRQFHVNMEGSRKLTNYDIFAKAGGAMLATAETFTVNVTDGMLNIDFLTGAADLPRVSAIEVIPATQSLNAVADAYVRDGSYSATNYGNLPELDVKSAAGDASIKRSSYIRFQLPQTVNAGSAKLRIYGHNHENSKDIYVHAYGVDNDSWTENGISKNNAPAASTASLGSVAVNDKYKYYEIDVTSYVKAQQASGSNLVTLLLADPNNRNTRLVFNSKENSANPPQLVIQPASVSNSSARLNQEGIMAENAQAEQGSSIYPNPVKKQFTVSLSMQHAGPISFELVSSAGKGYAVRTTQDAKAGEKAEVNISDLTLSTGIYMLKIQSQAATEVIKMLVTE